MPKPSPVKRGNSENVDQKELASAIIVLSACLGISMSPDMMRGLARELHREAERIDEEKHESKRVG